MEEEIRELFGDKRYLEGVSKRITGIHDAAKGITPRDNSQVGSTAKSRLYQPKNK